MLKSGWGRMGTIMKTEKGIVSVVATVKLSPVLLSVSRFTTPPSFILISAT
jgi:hypothetical protein